MKMMHCKCTCTTTVKTYALDDLKGLNKEEFANKLAEIIGSWCFYENDSHIGRAFTNIESATRGKKIFKWKRDKDNWTFNATVIGSEDYDDDYGDYWTDYTPYFDLTDEDYNEISKFINGEEEQEDTIFIVRDKSTGTPITGCESFYDAELTIEQFEAEDKENGCYSEDYYEVVPSKDMTFEPEESHTVNVYRINDEYTLEVFMARNEFNEMMWNSRLVKKNYGIISDCGGMPVVSSCNGKLAEKIHTEISESCYVAMTMNQIDIDIDCLEEDIERLESF